MYDVEPCLQIRSNSIYAYNKYPRRSLSRSLLQTRSAYNLRTETYTGTLRPGAKKRLTKAIEFLVMLTKKPKKIINHKGVEVNFRLSFLTLTIAQSGFITAKDAHTKLLEPFLRWMRETYNCKLYIWKAELQQRGQLHYHITSDCFIHYKGVRKKWNDLQKDAGLLNEHYAKYGNYNPPGTEIRNVRKIKNIGHYLVKEIAKSFQNEVSVGGKVWDCSKYLKGNEFFTVHADNGTQTKINELIDIGEVRYILTDFCTIYQFLKVPPESILERGSLVAFERALKEILEPLNIVTEPPAPDILLMNSVFMIRSIPENLLFP